MFWRLALLVVIFSYISYKLCFFIFKQINLERFIKKNRITYIVLIIIYLILWSISHTISDNIRLNNVGNKYTRYILVSFIAGFSTRLFIELLNLKE